MILLETIQIKDGKPIHLYYHNQRFNKARKELFNIVEIFDLAVVINPPNNGDYRCRVVYGDTIYSVEYLSYTPKEINRIMVVESSIEYSYKYENREQFNQLLSDYSNSDDVLIFRNGLVSDTTIANIAFLDGNRWITPKTPLLEGTTRQRLIDEGLLTLKDIRSDEIFSYNGVALMNAMVGFRIITPIWMKAEVNSGR